MKKLLLVSMAVIMAASCVKNPNIKPDPIITSRLTTVEKFSVPIKEGYTSLVTIGSDTMCVSSSPTSIWIPKNADVTAKSEGNTVAISYIKGIEPNEGTSQMWQSVGFEDSEVGDYDYNDIVIHAKYELSKSKKIFGIGIHPIALGSTKIIAIGCKIFVKEVLAYDQIVISNAREELFDSQEGFINTKAIPNYHTNYFKKIITIDVEPSVHFTDIKVVWYIKVDNNRYYYAVNDHYGYLDGNKRPYGIVITNTGRVYYQDKKNPEVGYNWFPYPYEGVNINDAYPTFDKWINGLTDYCDMSTSIDGKSIDPGDYMYNRSDLGPTRVYYIVKKVI